MTVRQPQTPGESPRPPSPEWIVGRLAQMRELYTRLDELSREQSSLIDSGDTDSLLHLLGRRERLVEQIGQVGAELEPYRRRWGELIESLPEPVRGDVKRGVEHLSALAGAIASRDEDDRRTMEDQRRAVNSELAELSRGRSALAAYSPGAGKGARMQDREA
jgi:hypothetical protein